MAILKDTGNLISANGTYDVEGLQVGTKYLLTFKTDSTTTAAASIQFNNGPSGSFVPVDNGDYLASTDKSEDRLVTPSDKMRITVSGYTAPIQVTLATIRD